MARSLQKRAVDSLISQLLSKIGDGAHVIGPGARLSVLDSHYVGPLKALLQERRLASLRPKLRAHATRPKRLRSNSN